MAQLEARLNGIQEAEGSNPSSSNIPPSIETPSTEGVLLCVLSGGYAAPIYLGGPALSRYLADFSDNLVVFRESPRVKLGEYQLAVKRDVENPAAARNQVHVCIELVFNGVRQSGGFRFVVSLGAVGYIYIHPLLLD